jgi:mannose-6-phosphate isomerase
MQLSASTHRPEVFASVQGFLDEKGFSVVSRDHARPWGGFFVLDENQAPQFITTFFPHLSLEDFAGYEKLSPKILVVAPDQRLSWQYHHRRAEIWKLIGGVAGVIISDTDEQTDLQSLAIGDVVNLKCGERHRLVGTDGYGVVAEIWQHTDKANPSDEDDIVRVQDDFGR